MSSNRNKSKKKSIVGKAPWKIWLLQLAPCILLPSHHEVPSNALEFQPRLWIHQINAASQSTSDFFVRVSYLIRESVQDENRTKLCMFAHMHGNRDCACLLSFQPFRTTNLNHVLASQSSLQPFPQPVLTTNSHDVLASKSKASHTESS